MNNNLNNTKYSQIIVILFIWCDTEYINKNLFILNIFYIIIPTPVYSITYTQQ